jgi:hypothetical protein
MLAGFANCAVARSICPGGAPRCAAEPARTTLVPAVGSIPDSLVGPGWGVAIRDGDPGSHRCGGCATTDHAGSRWGSFPGSSAGSGWGFAICDGTASGPHPCAAASARAMLVLAVSGLSRLAGLGLAAGLRFVVYDLGPNEWQTLLAVFAGFAGTRSIYPAEERPPDPRCRASPGGLGPGGRVHACWLSSQARHTDRDLRWMSRSPLYLYWEQLPVLCPAWHGLSREPPLDRLLMCP